MTDLRYHRAVRRGALFLATILTTSCSLLVGEGFSSDPAPAGSDASTANDDGLPSNEDGASNGTDSSSDAKSLARYPSAVLADSPIGYWRCGEKTGTTLADSSGHGHPATINTPLGTILDRPGALAGDADGAIELDGSAHIDLGDLFDFPGTAPYTFELWVKPRASDGRLGKMFDKMKRQANTGVPIEGSLLYYDPNWNGAGPRVGLERWVGGSAVEFIFDEGASALLPTDRFTHVVIAFDGNSPRYFRDGVLKKIGSGNDSIADNTIPFHWADGLVGTIDELAIYDVALPLARIQAHYGAAQ